MKTFTAIFLLLSIGSSWLGLSSPLMSLNENQVLYLFSTSAQVIAAIYGLTLTGFLFFRTELNREAIDDDTLVEAIEQLKSRYYSQLVFITILVALSLLSANLAISHETSLRLWGTTVLINVGQSAYVVALLAIALFVFDVVAPQRVERASQRLQDKLDPSRDSHEPGSLEEFLRNYNQVELLLADSAYAYPVRSSTTFEPKARRISNSRLADFLLKAQRISHELHQKLRELITLRNAIIHGAEPVVSLEIVQASAQVLRELRIALERESPSEP